MAVALLLLALRDDHGCVERPAQIGVQRCEWNESRKSLRCPKVTVVIQRLCDCSCHCGLLSTVCTSKISCKHTPTKAHCIKTAPAFPDDVFLRQCQAHITVRFTCTPVIAPPHDLSQTTQLQYTENVRWLTD